MKSHTRTYRPLAEPASSMLAYSSADLDLPLNDVVLVFSANELFVPYLSVALQSILDHTSSSRRYDIIVLTSDISPTSMLTLTRQVKSDNVGIGFLEVDAALGDIKLPRHGHFRAETYYRLLAPALLANVDKAIYMDSDVIAVDDVAKLFDIDVSGYPLGATSDADTLGQIGGYDPSVGTYLRDELGLDDPGAYFQAGVLLMNLAHLREMTTPEMLLWIASVRTWRWLDQDVLNKVVNGNYKRIHMRWNYLMDWQHLRASHIVTNAPKEVQDEYAEAAANPGIIHYAGPDNRPWLYIDCDHAEDFWKCAVRSPYLGELRDRLERSKTTPLGLVKRLQVAAIYKVIMPVLDKVCPAGTKRRRLVIDGFRVVGGKTI